MERYQGLKLKESLCKPFQYVLACKELSFILKNGYSKFPKDLQSLILQETLFAFSLLPQMQTQSAISAANSVLQSAEFVLPKQKRASAVKEYKSAVVASKRKSKKNQEEQDLISLPPDVLVHIFSFLDLQSLISASAVSRSWNAAAGDNYIWKLLYAIFFCDSDNVTKHNGIETRGATKNDGKIHSLEDIETEVGIDWKYAFKTEYRDTCYRNSKCYRGFCSGCRSIVWLSNKRCSNQPNLEDGIPHHIQPISTQQIIEYILEGYLSSDSSSDSDSDTDDTSFFKLWAYPRQISQFL